jgi:hypothetical protein
VRFPAAEQRVEEQHSLLARGIAAVSTRVYYMINDTRVAKLADAPDLELPNHRFQSDVFRFKAKCLYEGKTAIFSKSRNASNGE